MLLDTRQSLETPEGANLPLTPAGVGARILAQLIDLAIRFAISILLFIVLALLGEMGMGLALIFTFLLEWFYPVAFEVARQGRTPGKKMMGLRVVHDDGTPITFGASLLRNLLRVVDFLPLFYLAGIIASVCNSQFKRIGDIAAGTLVIYDTPPLQEPSFDIRGQQAVPADFSTDEQRSLLAFAERSKHLSSERQHELAAILAPVLGDRVTATKDLVVVIKQMANTMVGKQ